MIASARALPRGGNSKKRACQQQFSWRRISIDKLSKHMDDRKLQARQYATSIFWSARGLPMMNVLTWQLFLTSLVVSHSKSTCLVGE
jgi:hypothetical protein